MPRLITGKVNDSMQIGAEVAILSFVMDRYSGMSGIPKYLVGGSVFWGYDTYVRSRK